MFSQFQNCLSCEVYSPQELMRNNRFWHPEKRPNIHDRLIFFKFLPKMAGFMKFTTVQFIWDKIIPGIKHLKNLSSFYFNEKYLETYTSSTKFDFESKDSLKNVIIFFQMFTIPRNESIQENITLFRYDNQVELQPKFYFIGKIYIFFK